MDKLKVYGANWCGDTRRTRAHLDKLKLSHQYVDVDADPKAKEWVKQQNGGKQKIPVVEVGQEILIEPANDKLDEAIERAGSNA